MSKKKRFCVIGLGNFGFNVAKTLYEDGHEVVAIDSNREKIQKIQDFSSFAILADAANKEFLASQGVHEMDAVIVCIGERSHISTLITLYCKEIQVPEIIVKAINEDHGRILEKIGATRVIYPEKDMAIKVAKNLSKANIIEFMPLSSDYIISEASPFPDFIGKNLIELDFRKQFGISIVGIKDLVTGNFDPVPAPAYIIKESDVLVVVGKAIDIQRAFRS
jgi:trk system potassium uptake protein